MLNVCILCAQGLEPTLWRHATWNGGYFGVIDYLRKLIPARKVRILFDCSHCP